jgi:hypothetical protein
MNPYNRIKYTMPCNWKPSTTTTIIGVSITCASYFIFRHFSQNKQPIVEEEEKLSPEEQYIQQQLNAFLSTYSDNLHCDKHNQNIEKAFYNKEEYKNAVSEKDNMLESTWKSRILFESTPRGNVTMHYDAYKHAFAYCSDVSISYSILNAVAMKYVRVFSCRDFFLDDSIIPNGNKTPFLTIHNLDESKKKELKFDVKKGPFAKLKKYTGDKTNERKSNERKSNEVKSSGDITKNKFISLGKMYNFSILNKKGLENVKLSPQNQTVSDKPMKYSDFKSWRNPEAIASKSGDSIANQFDAFSDNA